ncbi:hypothetical protein [uncultured Lamprocystis sp.]|jgi:hypothetical protein|uniref:hypothetical protein n=1 Tax=uncultured Lamprocystis sp. TaxID=543132 RepID=UPI0025DE64D6|nr:hypothetical protein [uncultured Lamprocystis sp.]
MGVLHPLLAVTVQAPFVFRQTLGQVVDPGGQAISGGLGLDQIESNSVQRRSKSR